MADEARIKALARACDLMTERYGRELTLKVEARRRQEEDLRQTGAAILHINAILPQSTCSALRRIAALEQSIATASADIASLRQTVITWTARRDMLTSRASALQSHSERRQIEEEIFEGLNRGKSEASS